MDEKSVYKLFLFFVVVLAGLLVLSSFNRVQFAPAADEGYYLGYATKIGSQGISGFAGLFQEYLSDTRHWVFPNPLRIGFIALSALWLKIFGYSFIHLAGMSLFFYLLFLLVSYYFSQKYFGRQLALFFVILLAFSPLQMAMARRALLESAVNFSYALSVWLFWEFLQSRSRKKLVFFLAALTLSILIKETGILLIFVFATFLLAKKFIFKKEVGVGEVAAILFVPPVLAGLVYWALGCLSYVPATIKIILDSPKTNIYAIMFGSGPWYSSLIDYLILSPWVFILAIGFAFVYLMHNRDSQLPGYFIFILLVNLALLSIFTKNVRYLIILDTPLRLFAVLMLYRISRLILPRHGLLLTFILVVILACGDYLNFYDLFLRAGIYDPVSFLLLKAKQIIPYN